MKLLILILSLLFTFSYATTNQQLQMQINEIKQEQKNLNNKIKEQHAEVDKLDTFTQKAFDTANNIANQSSNLISQSNSDIGNKLSVIQFIIVVGGLVFGFFGVYIEYTRRKIEETLQNVKSTSDDIDKKKQDLENFINNNETMLYNKMMQRDADNILDHLDLYPELISNLWPIINLRDLGYSPKNWEQFKKIVVKYKQSYPEDRYSGYLYLAVDHFCNHLIKCDDNDEIIIYFLTNKESYMLLEREKAMSILRVVIKANQIHAKICEIIFFVLLSGTHILTNKDSKFKGEFLSLMEEALRNQKHAHQAFQELHKKHPHLNDIIDSIINKPN